MATKMTMMDGNQAAAHVAHKVNEVIAIYPITPSSAMGELADAWSAADAPNIWGTVPDVIEMQSEGGAAGAVHGALQTGSLVTTFTASQGLLLMIPTLYKLAGELTSTCLHVSARSLACQALSIFGDHSDVMAVRQTGVALLSSNSVQEAMDLALIGSAATLETRLPFIHFFDGFRTSHEIQKIEELDVDTIKAMIDDEKVLEHRARGLTPDKPVLRGTSQNPDVYFQGRESVNKYYLAAPAIVQNVMDRFAKLTGRQYNLFDYVGDENPEKIIVLMGSGAETADEAICALIGQGMKVGVLKVRLYRPFCNEALAKAIPASVKSIAVLDRQKEPGAPGEPLFLDVVNALVQTGRTEIDVVGGRYGLSSKEFTPAMIKGIFEQLGSGLSQGFTVGINDDVTNLSISFDPDFHTEEEGMVQAMFYGLGSDGTVGANKNSIKIIGGETDNYAQGYFVYDSKKAGAITTSHLRFGPNPIRSTYLICKADFVACHQFSFLEKYDMLANLKDGGTFLLNCPMAPADLWDKMPIEVQKQIIDKNIKFYAINAYDVAKATGMGGRINTIMQTCFFHLSGVLPPVEAVEKIKEAIKKTYGKKGDKIVEMNNAAVDGAVAGLVEMAVPAAASSAFGKPPVVSADAPTFVKEVTATIMAGKGDDLPVSKMPVDGTWPTATTQWEKRNIAMEIPAWDPEVCIQCAKCNIVCPHAAIRLKIYDAEVLENAPATFKSADAKTKAYAGKKATIQIAPEDCTGCGACVHACPARNKEVEGKRAINMTEQAPLRAAERENYAFFLESIPEYDRTELKTATVKGSQLCQPLFEYSGACAGCGETPYVKLLTQLFGDRLIIGNATGCSSIYGGNLPTTPYSVDKNGRGPAWNNSLFEDNAEFTFGFRLTMDKRRQYAAELLAACKENIGAELVNGIIENMNAKDETSIAAQRARIDQVKDMAASCGDGCCSNQSKAQLMSVIDSLCHKSVWAMGGDGWAYDIGYGGLDHVLASTRDINVIVMDTMVYSNTGGQASKATPRGAVAKFAASGKPSPKKDLGMIAMSYGNIYVAQIAMGASDAQAVKAFAEADAYPGCSLVIAYSHCIAHGINMETGQDQQKAAVDSGFWPLYRFDPRLAEQGKNPLQLDSKEPSISFEDFAYNETRWTMLAKSKPEHAKELLAQATADVASRWHMIKQLAALSYSDA